MRTVSRSRHTTSPAVRALLLVSALVLSGCASSPEPVPSEKPTAAAPVFASDEEALAAATEAYAAYQAMSDSITAEGGRNPERIERLASAEYLEELLAGFEGFSQKHRSSIGQSDFDTVSLVSVHDDLEGEAVVDLYLCLDLTDVRLVDSAGDDITPINRPNRIPLQIGFVSSARDASVLLVSREDVWSAETFC